MTQEMIIHHPKPNTSIGHDNSKASREDCKHCNPREDPDELVWDPVVGEYNMRWMAEHNAHQGGKSLKTGTELISEERTRQVEEEGYTAEHDAEHPTDDLVKAAIVYAWNYDEPPHSVHANRAPSMWPWEESSWKPEDDPVRNLVKAGALIAAAIDRLKQ